MPPAARAIQRTYLVLLLGTTLAASLIWGINTIFLLDAGLTNLEAFSANAFFTAGMLIFEVPTGIVADTTGRRRSFLLGTITLSISTLLYVMLWQIHAPFVWWAIVSVLIGLGFTFFSGATEAWLVDALNDSGFTGDLESVFGRGQVVTGIAMLVGSVAGGLIARRVGLGAPFVLRGVILIAVFAVAWRLMHDVGFKPRTGASVRAETARLWSETLAHGWRVPAVKWLMVQGIFVGGVGIYAFYALQPYLLELYGDPEAYQIAGLVAAIVAGAQILGGVAAPLVRKMFRRRTSALLAASVVAVFALGGIGMTGNFYAVVALIVVWALLFAASRPIRQTYLNGVIPSQQRASILSFDSMMASGGGVVVQPALGRAADVWGYGATYLMGAGISALAIPFLALSRAQNLPADSVTGPGGPEAREPGTVVPPDAAAVESTPP